jgi:hypothetical protein
MGESFSDALSHFDSLTAPSPLNAGEPMLRRSLQAQTNRRHPASRNAGSADVPQGPREGTHGLDVHTPCVEHLQPAARAAGSTRR